MICSGDATLSLPRKHRLSRSQDVNAVFENGKFYKGRYCHVFVGPSDVDILRAAFVVSPKTARTAVDRNRIKRLMRESVRLRLDDMKGKVDLVFLATRNAHAELRRQDFDEDLDNFLTGADLLDRFESSVDSS